MDYLEALRPSFWSKGDSSFLWIYVLILILLFSAYVKLRDSIYHKKTFSEESLNRTRLEVRSNWERRQEELRRARVYEEDKEEEKLEPKPDIEEEKKPEPRNSGLQPPPRPVKKAELNRYDPSGPRIGRPSSYTAPCATGTWR
ncbi:unnamed protein product [Blepharisma stoltei]|uniref:Selenoprotein S n=1 Tax=Blepharisma stoltei TaxID=1481888 RepID=A0AAU9IRW4_9CILI|nr:unnamed protein product [Blepharisma stoltei]